MTTSIHILDLSQEILKDSAGWEQNRNKYRADPASSMPKSGISRENYMLYVRAMSRVLVDVMTLTWNKDLSEEKQVTLLAAGATNITSDYDVSFAGWNASKLAAEIETAFQSQTCYELAAYADTNLYVLPLLSLTPQRAQFLGGPANLLDLHATSLYVPYPTQANGGEDVSLAAARSRL
jgi:hypothetical protein